ncbi:MAG: IS200/IS605 family element transposase accessory protein TnpB [Candidatus Competibacteraceae bacterium]|nr:IS200/IS605 family element transposase accessory protein TnpB [Candidatus Competibacteraceae bacterium]
MKATRTVKLKLTSETTRFTEVALAYRDAANWLSPIVFNLGNPTTPAKLSKEFYATVREKFQLPSQVACSLFRHVVAAYRSMKSNGHCELAVFKKLVVPLCWRRDFMEDLTGIRKSKKPTHHKQRARNNRWPFKQCQFYVSYKAAAKGIGIEFVSPAHTSQSCPICGHTEKANRNGFEFRCMICNFADHTDRVGSINISLRSLLQRQAVGERASINTLIVADEGNVPVQLQTPSL